MKAKFFVAATACLMTAGALMSFTYNQERGSEFKVTLKNDTDDDFVIYHKEGSGRLYHGYKNTYDLESGEKVYWAPDDSPNDKHLLFTTSDDMSGKTVNLSDYVN